MGLPWSEDEFFERAIKQNHPLEDQPELPDRTKEAIFTMLTEGPEAWVKATKEKLDQVKKLRDELEDRERELKRKDPQQGQESQQQEEDPVDAALTQAHQVP